MWSSRLFWKLFLVYVGLSLTVVVAFVLTVTAWQRTQVNEHVQQRLSDTAILLRSHTSDHISELLAADTDTLRQAELRTQLQTLVGDLSGKTGIRLTLVDAAGVVLADSQRNPREMDNHRDRPELIDAARHGLGTTIRRSPTLDIEMSYFAIPLRDGDKTIAMVRTATELDTINRRVSSIRWFLLMFALAVGLVATLLTYLVVGRIIQPLTALTRSAHAVAQGKQEYIAIVDAKDEVGLLAESFQQMNRKLVSRIHESRENRDQLATILGSMDEGIVAVDADEKILMANEAGCRLLNLDREAIEGRPLMEAVRIYPLHETVSVAMRNGHSRQTELETSHEPRRTLLVRATCLPGDPRPGAVIVLHDVTELRRLESLRYELFANVSHELKTPLAAVKAAAETLRLGAINDPQHNMEFVSCIEDQAERLHQLILDMLHIARIESGQETFDIVAVDVAQTVNECLEQNAGKAGLKNITFEISSTDAILRVRADEEGLSTILENLVDNAIKYTPDGGIVTVDWQQQAGQVVLQVADTGIGIAESDQARVFERFFRVDKARSRELGGTGLGLSIVKHLAQSFGDGVEVTSEPGKGSTFSVRLP
ncbi:MAG: ATP-binding protein, partial [Pirellulales bacterium]